jgi:cellulose synthase/poly-beta-1,6-N-acetylglucosamine synthase-like glycosyltransferase
LNIITLIQTLIIITGSLLFIYAPLIYYYHRIWDQIPTTTDRDLDLEKSDKSVKVSVIIPARNEGLKIGQCLDALFNQSYPKSLTELIVVNDFSSDDTFSVASGHQAKCIILNLSDYVQDNLNSYKKKAIETGIAHSSGELILCTDADCTMEKDWIKTMVSAYEKENLDFIAAPVKISGKRNWLSVFQTLDFISLQGITGAAVYKKLYPMCNGANLGYTRKAYDAVDGFSDIDNIASGDDMLLMKKIQERFPNKIGYVKDERAIVSTEPMENISAFLNQRIRWASKISHYKHVSTFITLALVYLVNLFLTLLFVSCLFYGHWRWLLILLTFKTISEYFFVVKVARFFRQQSLVNYFILCQPFHILYTVIAGGFGSFGKYEWKNRKVK